MGAPAAAAALAAAISARSVAAEGMEGEAAGMVEGTEGEAADMAGITVAEVMAAAAAVRTPSPLLSLVLTGWSCGNCLRVQSEVLHACSA